MKNIQLISLVAITSLGLVACGGGSSADNNSNNTGTLNVSLTDNPACGMDHVYVTVKEVKVHSSSTAKDSDAGWYSVKLANPKKIDLLTLTNGALTTLGQTPLPAGRYTQIRLVLDQNQGSKWANSVVPTGGTELALTTPSAAQSGYKVVGSFDVKPDTLVDLVLDFDACQSIVKRGNGSYNLKPVVTATPQVVSGTISGFVSPSLAQAGATVYAQQNGEIIKGTPVPATGDFKLMPLVQSKTNGNYDIVITAPGYATAVIKSVPVTAEQTTTISTQALPINTNVTTHYRVSGTATPSSDLIEVNAKQTSGGTTYTVNTINATLDTGAYSLSLSTGAPYLGPYTGTLPIVFTPDNTVNGQYTISATDTVKATTQNAPVTISTMDVNNINFNF